MSHLHFIIVQRVILLCVSVVHGLRSLIICEKMKRRTADRSVTEDLSSKRIVRRKLDTRSPSPEMDTHSKREVRSTVVYSKYEDKYEEEKYSRSRHTKSLDQRIGKCFIDKPRQRYTEISLSGGGTNRKNYSEHGPRHVVGEKFEYSLRVGNIDFKMADGEVKTALFKEFKRFGYINVKVLGFGRERHAFINFSRPDDARRARRDMQNITFNNRVLNLEWSKSTLRKFPDLLTGTSGGGMGGRTVSTTKKRTLAPADGSYEYSRDRGSGGRGSQSDHFSSRGTTRDISYRNTPTTTSYSSPHHSSQSRTHTSHHSSSSNVETKSVTPVLDPNATRTLFVGNLEQDITERELRDLFSPYGRIESVDIKLQRSTGTAYAFVKFLTINDALNAKNDMHGRQYGDLRLKIGFGRGSPSAKVWIGNLTTHADMSEIRNELDRFGLIRRIDYNSGDSHAFVHFDSLDAAQAAISSMSGYRFRTTGRSLKIDICKPLHMRGDNEEYDPDYHSSKGSSHSDTTTRKHHATDNGSHDDSGQYRRHWKVHSSHHYGTNGQALSPPSSSSDRYHRTNRDNPSTHSGGGSRIHSNDRNFHRKRPRSPSSRDQYEGGGYRQRPEEDDMSGDILCRPKRPRNGLDSHHRLSEDKKQVERDRPPSSGEPMDMSSDAEFIKRASPPERLDADEIDQKSMEKKPDLALRSEPSPPSPNDITSSDIADTALKLTGATEPISPDSDTKSVKPECPLNPETLADLAKLYPIAWRGNLVLKNTGFPTRMHLVGGDPTVAELLLRSKDGKDDLIALRITQRLRLEPPRLEEVNKRMASAGPSGHCILVAFPGPTPSLSSPDGNADTTIQLRPLKSLVSYLKQKEAAGIVALSTSEGSENAVSDSKDSKDIIGVLHAFPPCDFSQNQLLKIAPNLGSEPPKEDHIVVLLVKGTV